MTSRGRESSSSPNLPGRSPCDGRPSMKSIRPEMRVSVVVLNFGYREFVFECLSSLNKVDGRERVEVILVDNGSSAEDREKLIARLAIPANHVEKTIFLTKNDGFAAGMNAGIREATGDLVIALNADARLGKQVIRRLQAAIQDLVSGEESKIGFLSLPVYDWDFGPGRSHCTSNWQTDHVALTPYVSCLPVRWNALKDRFVLGPAGACVVMTRQLVDEMTDRFGAIYDPHFFLYGEDVDLFLRARRLGFQTRFLDGDPLSEQVVWHIGSAFSTDDGTASLQKSPRIARHILAGCWSNALAHSGWLELPFVITLQILFRLTFYAAYARRQSLRKLLELWAVRLPHRPRRMAGLKRPWGFRLLSRMALFGYRPLPWARSEPSASGRQHSRAMELPTQRAA